MKDKFGDTKTAEERTAQAAEAVVARSTLWSEVAHSLDWWAFALFALTVGVSRTRHSSYASPVELLAHQWRLAGMAPEKCESCGRPY